MSLLALPLLTLLPILQDGATPSARQRKSLVPLIEVMTQRLAPHLATVEQDYIERIVKKAISDQISAIATRDLMAGITKLIATDIGVDSKDGWKLIKRKLLDDFATDYTPEELALLGEEFDLGAFQLELKPRFLRSASEAVYMRGFEYLHSRVVRHTRHVLAELEEEVEPKLERDQAKGMKELAKIYAVRMHEVFAIEKPDRDYEKLLLQALSTPTTDRAMLATLVSAKRLARPSVRRVFGAKSTRELTETEKEVRVRVVRELTESKLLEELRSDHVAMLNNPKGFRKRLAEREKDD
ncbi:MAG: hypothetical protein GY711_12965 [bacterium]|nr:hypothetical protein [bacterium]